MIDLTKKAWATKLHPSYEKKTYYIPKKGSVDRNHSAASLEGSTTHFNTKGREAPGHEGDNATERL